MIFTFIFTFIITIKLKFYKFSFEFIYPILKRIIIRTLFFDFHIICFINVIDCDRIWSYGINYIDFRLDLWYLRLKFLTLKYWNWIKTSWCFGWFLDVWIFYVYEFIVIDPSRFLSTFFTRIDKIRCVVCWVWNHWIILIRHWLTIIL